LPKHYTGWAILLPLKRLLAEVKNLLQAMKENLAIEEAFGRG